MDITAVLLKLYDMLVHAIIPFVGVLGIMIFVHELGHYLAARAIGVRVLEFKLGFGKWIVKTRRGHTDYGIGLFPIGGYVKMFGDPTEVEGGEEEVSLEEIPEAEKNEALYFKPASQKMLVFFAGPLMNILFAFLVAPSIYLMGIQEPVVPMVVGAVEAGSPAQVAGIEPGDKIVSVDGKHFKSVGDYRMEEALNPNQELAYVVEREGREKSFKVKLDETTGKDRLGFSGIDLVPSHAEVQTVLGGSAADKAGIKPGDVIIAVDGNSVNQDELSGAIDPKVLGAAGVAPNKSYGEPTRELTILIRRGGQEMMSLKVTPQFDEQRGRYMLGISHSPETRMVKYGLWGSMVAGSKFCVKNVTDVYKVLWKLLSGQLSPRNLAGPVGIGAITSQSTRMEGWTPLISLMVLIAINLGILNLLPFPPLDGGHVIFTVLEVIIGREINVNIKEKVFYAGFMLLITMMVLVTINDFYRFGDSMLNFFKSLGQGLGL